MICSWISLEYAVGLDAEDGMEEGVVKGGEKEGMEKEGVAEGVAEGVTEGGTEGGTEAEGVEEGVEEVDMSGVEGEVELIIGGSDVVSGDIGDIVPTGAAAAAAPNIGGSQVIPNILNISLAWIWLYNVVIKMQLVLNSSLA